MTGSEHTNSKSFIHTGWIFSLVAVTLFGCNSKNVTEQAEKPPRAAEVVTESSQMDGPTAEKILMDLRAKYANLDSYRDQTTLYLNYRLHDQAMQEPQPWSTTWRRDGKLSSKLFNSRLVGDGNTLSCYVYDIDSGNLDDQYLLIPYQRELPLKQLYRDAIARHFVGGFSELPLDESVPNSVPELVPSPLALLNPFIVNPWLETPEQLQRLSDDQVDGQPCFVVRSLAKGMTADIWISQNDSSLVRMSLPLKLLAGKVITSPEVTDVALLAEFKEAQFNPTIPDETFWLEERPDSKLVRKFVAVPEVFPSEMIGEPAPEFQLTVSSGRARTRVFFEGKITALLWLAGENSIPDLDALNKIADQFENDKFHFAAIYSDSELERPGSGSIQPKQIWKNKISNLNIPVYYDRQLEASSRFKINAVPAIVVIDASSKIQFSRALSDEGWKKDLEAVLKRVANGEDVAQEMKQEYQHFLDSYHQQVITMSAEDLLSKTRNSDQEIPPSANSRSIELRPEQTWSFRDAQSPGNVKFVDDDHPRLLVFDGWRTVLELSLDGKLIRRTEVDLPDGVAVSNLRIGRMKDEFIYGLFATVGRQVFLFDKTWRHLGTYPQTANEPIWDFQFVDANGNSKSELVVSFDGNSGLRLVDSTSLESEPIGPFSSKSIAAYGQDIALTDSGKIKLLKSKLSNSRETEMDMRRVVSSRSEQLCAIGTTRTGSWTAIGLDGQLARQWTIAVGPQYFENEIEPVASIETSMGDTLWALADSNHVIHLVSGTGKWLGDFQSQSALSGLELATYNRQTQLIVVNKDGVHCWNLNLDSPMIAISHQKKN